MVIDINLRDQFLTSRQKGGLGSFAPLDPPPISATEPYMNPVKEHAYSMAQIYEGHDSTLIHSAGQRMTLARARAGRRDHKEMVWDAVHI